MDVRKAARAVTAEEAVKLRLQSDPLWHKMNFEYRERIATETVDWADRAAQRYAELHAADTMSALRAEYRLKVTETEASQEEMLLFSPKVDVPHRKIELDMYSIHRIAQWMQSFGWSVSTEDVIQMQFMTAFHAFFARNEDLLPSDHLPGVPVRRWGLFPSHDPVLWADLAAADRFAERTCAFPTAPILLPYLYLVDTGKASVTAFKQVLENLRKDKDEDSDRD